MAVGTDKREVAGVRGFAGHRKRMDRSDVVTFYLARPTRAVRGLEIEVAGFALQVA